MVPSLVWLLPSMNFSPCPVCSQLSGQNLCLSQQRKGNRSCSCKALTKVDIFSNFTVSRNAIYAHIHICKYVWITTLVKTVVWLAGDSFYRFTSNHQQCEAGMLSDLIFKSHFKTVSGSQEHNFMAFPVFILYGRKSPESLSHLFCKLGMKMLVSPDSKAAPRV